MGDQDDETMRQEQETEEVTETARLSEAATYKAQAMRLMRDMAALLADRTVPSALRKEVEDVRQALRKTWKDLAAEPEMEEPKDDEEPEEEESEEFRDRFQRAMGMMESFGFEPVETPPSGYATLIEFYAVTKEWESGVQRE